MSEASRRLGNLALLMEQAEPHESLEAFMQEATLEMDQSEQAAGIQVMTVHASKGLEFQKVRLPFWIEGIFPHSRALEEGDAAIEEERRLAYVALTRAIEDVRISRSWKLHGCPFIRTQSNRPSRFIEEIRRSPKGSIKLTSISRSNDPVYRLGPVKPAAPRPERSDQSEELRLPDRQTLTSALGLPHPDMPNAEPDPAAQASFFDHSPAFDEVPQDPDDRPFAPISEEDFERIYAHDPELDPDSDFEPSF